MAGCLMVSDVEDGIVRLVLNRPQKKNALSIELPDAVSDALGRIAGDEDVRVVILSGAGDTFCAGFDLGEFRIEEVGFQDRLWESSDRFHQRVLRFPLPTIAAVTGPALAGGFDLALLCDLRVADLPRTRTISPVDRARWDSRAATASRSVGNESVEVS